MPINGLRDKISTTAHDIVQPDTWFDPEYTQEP